MSGNRRHISLNRPFAMHRGGELDGVRIAYETWGELNKRRDNAILLFTGLSPSAHAASASEDQSPGWWEDMIGPGRAIDTDRYFLICVNSLGSCFGTTGPSSVNPDTEETYRLTFPILSIEDIAQCGADVIEVLGIDQVAYVIGPSMGGMSALAFAMMHPDRAAGLILISSAARALPFAIAMRSLQREIIRSDPEWNDGQYQGHGAEQGMHLARKLGMVSYRSADEWKQRFGRERAPADEYRHPDQPFGIEFEIESYLEHHARKFSGSFDANCYLYLSRAMDLFDAADHGGCLETGLACVKASRVLIVGVTSDILFPVEQQRELAALLQVPDRELVFEQLSSNQGHDSFLVDMDRFRPVLSRFLNAG
ncbi:MAG: homoserine O-acetyltransferase [Gammaproteobacteria bacterium]|nr:homoserine O-acetyltransferase [Gammaproteobacteria bacterium]MDH3768193.1 homoserine O-acetyltransferase [Gammaproteobacteria bacterium]